MKDKVVDNHPVTGEITYKDLINNLCILLQDYITLEDRILNIMKHNNYDNETISTLFSDNISDRLKSIIIVLKRLL